jgi:hypothetical protein
VARAARERGSLGAHSLEFAALRVPAWVVQFVEIQ